jgi:hypothetical protein
VGENGTIDSGCNACHNKPRGHPNTNNICEDCHTTRTWDR